ARPSTHRHEDPRPVSVGGRRRHVFLYARLSGSREPGADEGPILRGKTLERRARAKAHAHDREVRRGRGGGRGRPRLVALTLLTVLAALAAPTGGHAERP